MTENNTLDQIFNDLFFEDEIQDSNTAIPQNQWTDYLLLPPNLHGFFDTKQPLDDAFSEVTTAVYTVMARHCIRLNRALMMLCLGMKKRDTLQPAIYQFKTIHKNTADFIGESISIHTPDAYVAKLPFKRRDLPKDPQAASQVAGQLLYDLAAKELETILSSADAIFSNTADYYKHVYAYLGQSLASFFLAVNELLPTFIAYPFHCYDLFSHVDEAEGNTALEDIDYCNPPVPRGHESDESFDGIPAIHCISAIHTPTMTKQDLYIDDGTLHQIHWSTLDDLLCITDTPPFDLDDMDDYV